MNVNEMLDQAVEQAKEKNPKSFILIATAEDGQGLWTNINGIEGIAVDLIHALIEISMKNTKQEAHSDLMKKLHGIIDSVEKSISESTN